MNVSAWLKVALETIRMDLSRLRDLKVLLHDNYAYFATPLAPMQMQMYAEDLLAYPVQDVERAMRRWRLDGPPPGHKPRPPLPSDLIKIINPPVDEQAQANAIAATILACVGKFGHVHPGRAQEYMGETAWSVVQMRGSWSELCRTVTVDNFSGHHAQLRDSARAVLAMDAGRRNQLQALPAASSRRQLGPPRSIGAILDQANMHRPQPVLGDAL